MSGYIEVGYLVVLGSLGGYAVSLVSRERAARRRLPPPGTVDGTIEPSASADPAERP